MVALFQQMPELVLEQLHSIKRYLALGLNMSNKPHIFIAEDMGLNLSFPLTAIQAHVVVGEG